MKKRFQGAISLHSKGAEEFISPSDFGVSAIWKIRDFDITDCGGTAENIDMVGEVEMSCLNLEMMFDNGITIQDAFEDSPTINIAEYYDEIFTKNGEIRKSFRKNGVDELGLSTAGALHILQLVFIDSKYSGFNLVANVTKIYLENFARNTDLVFLQAFPLQHSEDTDLVKKATKIYRHDFTANSKETDIKRLADHYERIGFPRIGKTAHFFGTAESFRVGIERAMEN